MESDCVKSWPKNERPRERLLAEGAEKVSEADLLAVILRVGRGSFKKGVHGQNVSDFARSLVARFGSLRGLDRARVQDLLKVPGLGPAKVAQLKAAISVQKQIMKRVAAGREEIAREKANAERMSRESNAEMEALILGSKRIGT